MKARSINKLFHQTIYLCANNPEAIEIYERSQGLLGSLRKKHGYQSERLKKCVIEHKEIIDALNSRNGIHIENLVKAHIERAKDELLVLMQEV